MSFVFVIQNIIPKLGRYVPDVLAIDTTDINRLVIITYKSVEGEVGEEGLAADSAGSSSTVCCESFKFLALECFMQIMFIFFTKKRAFVFCVYYNE